MTTKVAMTPSTTKPVSGRQLNRAVDKIRTALHNHRSEFDSEGFQQALGKKELVPELLGIFRKYASVANVSSYDATTGTFQWEVNYDESIVAKTAVKDSKSIARSTIYATDEKFPDERQGKRIVTGRTKHFGAYIGQDAVETWAKENNKILALPKELIDFSKAFPQPALDKHMPLVAPGQSWQDSRGFRLLLYLGRQGMSRVLDYAWIYPGSQWHGSCRFLILDK